MQPIPSVPEKPQAYPSIPQPDQPRESPVRKRTIFPYLLIFAIGLIVLVMICLPLMVGVGGYVYYQMSARIAPGVQVGDTSLEWMTVEQAATVLHKDWNLERRLVVSDGLQSWTVSAADLGLGLDAIQTARSAFGAARRQAMWTEFGQMARSWLDGSQVAPIALVDLQKAHTGLLALNESVTKPPRDAQLTWDGSQLVVIPSELGYAIDISTTLRTLEASPGMVLTSGYLRLPLVPLIPKIADVTGAIKEAEQFLNTPLALNAYDPIREKYFHWDVSRQELGSWLTFVAGESVPVVGVDGNRVSAFLDTLSGTLDGDRWLDSSKYGPQLAQAVQRGEPFLMLVNHHPTTYVVQPGDTLISIGWKVGMPYWMILQANPDIDPDALLAGQTLTIPSKDELLPLPIIPDKRIVISIGEQHLWVFQNGNILSEHVISTGIDRSPTQPGIFQVQTHELEAYASVWDLYMPHFLGVYEAWPGFMNGIHGLPRLSNGRRLWKNILGKPASYGCIIMDLDEAEWLYNWAEAGVIVDIRP
jgi:lipoprotein-anchoring transpeptidase ErfK/SrfK